jgi:CheY-like chemotaxis protein
MEDKVVHYQFLEELKNSHGIDRNRLRIIILTSSENKKDAEEAALYNELVFSYLTKPLKEEKIKALMKVV